jgi:hypothetical protein
MTVSILSPSKCTPQDLAEFKKRVISGDAVNAAGLSERIREAFQLLFLYTPEKELVGIAALKRPALGYRADIFCKANSRLKPESYQLELGWIFVEIPHRKNKYHLLMISELLPHIGNEPIFATTRSDKRSIQCALPDFGFRREGEPYQSNEGEHRLLLFVRP